MHDWTSFEMKWNLYHTEAKTISVQIEAMNVLKKLGSCFIKKCPVKDFSKSHLCTDFGADTLQFGGSYTYLQSRKIVAK